MTILAQTGTQRGMRLLAAHLESLDPEAVPPRERLEAALGTELARKLLFALAPRRDGIGSEVERRGQKKFAELVAVSSTTPVDFPLRPLRAVSYDLPVLLRPTPAPRSAQEGMYGVRRTPARASRHENLAICER